MRKFVALLFFALPIVTLVGCQQDIVGTWCESIDDGSNCFGYETFYKDGKITAYGSYVETGVGYEMAGTWKFSEQDLCIKPIEEKRYKLKTREPIAFEADHELCVRIIDINRDSLRYIPKSGSKPVTMYRRP